MLSLPDASGDEATGAATKNKADMENKKGWKMSHYVHVPKKKGRRKMVFR